MKTLRVEKINKFCLTTIYYLNKIINLFQKSSSKPIILCYHSIDNENWRYSFTLREFKNQIIKLKKRKRIIPLSQIVNSDNNQLVNCAAVTFDDGYKNNFMNVAQFFKKLKIPAALFMIGDIDNANRNELENYKKLLELRDIKKIQELGWEIAYHTKTHSNLTKLNNRKLKDEILSGKKEFEEKLGNKVRYLAYPKGLCSNKVLEYVKKAGFEAAFTVDSGEVAYQHDKFRINRICMERIMEGKNFDALISPLGILFQKYFMKLLVTKEIITKNLFKFSI